MPRHNPYLMPLLIVGAVVLAALLWLAGDIFALFLVAFFIAYLFDPLAKRLVRQGLSRGVAAGLITVSLVVIVVGAAVLLGPVIYDQAKGLFQSLTAVAGTLPGKIVDLLGPYIPTLREDGIAGLFRPSEQPVGTIAAPIAARVFSGGLAFASTLGLVLLIPIITFYVLKDWPVMAEKVFTAVPAERRPKMRALAREMHGVLSAFLHGQAWVCIIDGVLYSIGLIAAGLQYGIVIGLVAGVLKFLPYIGTAIGGTIALVMAISQAGFDGWLIAGVLATFVAVELIENVLYPRIVGNRVKLPPALVIFAVLLGGKLMGILGVFIAVPAFAVARVAVLFWLRERRAREPMDAPVPEAQPARRQPRLPRDVPAIAGKTPVP
jgi:predicted PurR-regulated permease PerM